MTQTPHAAFASAAEAVVQKLTLDEDTKADLVVMLLRAYEDGHRAGMRKVLDGLKEPMAHGLLVLTAARARLTDVSHG